MTHITQLRILADGYLIECDTCLRRSDRFPTIHSARRAQQNIVSHGCENATVT